MSHHVRVGDRMAKERDCRWCEHFVPRAGMCVQTRPGTPRERNAAEECQHFESIAPRWKSRDQNRRKRIGKRSSLMGDKGFAPSAEEFSHLCDDAGNGTGNNLAIGDFATTPTTFFYECPAGFMVALRRLIVFIRSDGPMFNAGRYGTLPELALNEGVLVRVKDDEDTIRLDKLDGLEIRSNADWGRHCHDSREINFGGVADAFVSVRWSFFKDHRHGVVLTAGEKFEVHCRADLTGLADHRFQLRGDIHDV